MIFKINLKSIKILFAAYILFTSLANAVLVIDVKNLPYGKGSRIIRIVCIDTGNGIKREDNVKKFVFIEYRVLKKNAKTWPIYYDFQENKKFPILIKTETGVHPMCYDCRGNIFLSKNQKATIKISDKEHMHSIKYFDEAYDIDRLRGKKICSKVIKPYIIINGEICSFDNQSLGGIFKNPKDEYGILGELATDIIFRENGYDSYNAKHSGNHGFDGVYVKSNILFFTESKFQNVGKTAEKFAEETFGKDCESLNDRLNSTFDSANKNGFALYKKFQQSGIQDISKHINEIIKNFVIQKPANDTKISELSRLSTLDAKKLIYFYNSNTEEAIKLKNILRATIQVGDIPERIKHKTDIEGMLKTAKNTIISLNNDLKKQFDDANNLSKSLDLCRACKAIEDALSGNFEFYVLVHRVQLNGESLGQIQTFFKKTCVRKHKKGQNFYTSYNSLCDKIMYYLNEFANNEDLGIIESHIGELLHPTIDPNN